MIFMAISILLLWNPAKVTAHIEYDTTIVVGAERTSRYLPLLKDKAVGVVGNHSTLIGTTHLVDSLLSQGVNIKKVFSPEHGFRGDADAGQKVADGKDPNTGLPVISLYGKHKKPTAEDLEGLDMIVFDIQDVGARFYTYISTMTYVMEACAEYGKQVIILDRPNPNGFYVDGPVLEGEYSSFVGMHQVPVVHGMTIGEYAQMVNGEGWLSDGLTCDLTVIKCENYEHSDRYALPVKPSPNLPDMASIYLYPSLCFFEGTIMSIGRGTERPFTKLGHPDYPKTLYSFVPKSIEGASRKPKLKGETCYGLDLFVYGQFRAKQKGELNIRWLVDAYAKMPNKSSFFLKNGFINKLAGTSALKKQIVSGKTEAEIRASWQDDLAAFKTIRKKYLLYRDF